MGKSKARKTKRVDYKKLNTKGRESTDDEDGDIPSLEDLNLSNKYSKLMTLDKKRGTPQPDRSSGRKESKNNSDPEEQGVKQERFGPSPAVAKSMKEMQRENMAFQKMIGSDGKARDEFVDFYTEHLQRGGKTKKQIDDAIQRFVEFMDYHDQEEEVPQSVPKGSQKKTSPRKMSKIREELNDSRRQFEAHLERVKKLEREIARAQDREQQSENEFEAMEEISSVSRQDSSGEPSGETLSRSTSSRGISYEPSDYTPSEVGSSVWEEKSETSRSLTAGYETETESSSDTEGHRSKKKKGRKAYKPDNKRMNGLAKAFVKNNKKCSTMLHFQMNLEPWLIRTLEQEGINVEILDPVQGKKLPDEGLLVAKWRSELWNLLEGVIDHQKLGATVKGTVEEQKQGDGHEMYMRLKTALSYSGVEGQLLKLLEELLKCTMASTGMTVQDYGVELLARIVTLESQQIKLPHKEMLIPLYKRGLLQKEFEAVITTLASTEKLSPSRVDTVQKVMQFVKEQAQQKGLSQIKTTKRLALNVYKVEGKDTQRKWNKKKDKEALPDPHQDPAEAKRKLRSLQDRLNHTEVKLQAATSVKPGNAKGSNAIKCRYDVYCRKLNCEFKHTYPACKTCHYHHHPNKCGKCFECGGDHKASQCPQRQNQQRANTTVSQNISQHAGNTVANQPQNTVHGGVTFIDPLQQMTATQQKVESYFGGVTTDALESVDKDGKRVMVIRQ